MNWLKNWLNRTLGLLLPIGLAACAGPSATLKKTLHGMIAAQDFSGAGAYLQQVKQKEYGKKNAVLYYLDLGTVLHDAGKYRESDEHFDKAENRMVELYTKSLTKAAGMLLLNDNTVDYSGEAFERALTNVFRALNYVYMGKPDEALVEARKVEVFLDELNRHRENKSVYKDDAFARYLDGMLYEDAGKLDDSRISLQAAQKAYAWYASDYRTPTPRFDLSENGLRTKGEIVFIHYNGIGPRKVSKTFQVAWGEGVAAINETQAESDDEATAQRVQNALNAGILGKSITVAYPEYVQDPFAIAQSEIHVNNSVSPTQLMEDISAIAIKDLKDRIARIRLRAIARATIKYILAELAAQEIDKKAQEKPPANKFEEWLTNATKKGIHAAAAALEVADTRSWSTLPSQIRMARVQVAPGTYPMHVKFKDASGRMVSSHIFDKVIVKRGQRTYVHYRTAQ